MIQRNLTIYISGSYVGQVLKTCTFQDNSKGRGPKCSFSNTENVPVTTQFCLHSVENGLAMTFPNVQVSSERFDI